MSAISSVQRLIHVPSRVTFGQRARNWHPVQRRPKRWLGLGLLTYHLVALVAYRAEAQATEVPGRPQQTPIAVVGGTLHVGDGSMIEQGTIVFDAGRIVAVGKGVTLPERTETIHAAGKHIYPSLIEADSAIGLVEIDAVRASIDVREVGTLNPNVRAVTAFTPDSEIIPVTRANGILLAHTVPRGPFLTGQSALMMLDGWNATDMTLFEHVGTHITWPHVDLNPSTESTEREQSQLATLRQLIDDTRAYEVARGSDASIPVNLRLESMIPVTKRIVPLFVHADDASRIQSAIAFAVSTNLRIVIVGGYDAGYCADLLRQHQIPVIISSVQRLPIRNDDAPNLPFTLPKRLQDAGITFCIGGSGRFEASNLRNLPYHAGMAAAHGLLPAEALRAITLTPAEILGAADRVGSLAVGKDATLFIADGDILEIATQVEQAWVQGRAVDLNSRHTRLWKKFQQKYRP